MIRAILLVPSEPWRERLLGDGPCGGAPPVAYHYDNRPWFAGGRCTIRDWRPEMMPGREMALVLAHAGAVVREGRDRLKHAASDHHVDMEWRWDGKRRAWFDLANEDRVGYREVVDHDTGMDLPEAAPAALFHAWADAVQAERRGLGRVVLLDEQGVEVPRAQG